MKKQMPVLFALLGVLLFFTAGCAKEDVASSQEILIQVWGSHDFWKGEQSPGQRTVQDFNKKYAGKIRVEARYMPGPEYNTAIQAAIASNELPDLFFNPGGTDIRTMVALGLARPLDEFVSDTWKQQFYPGSFSEGINVINGKTYSWPLAGPQLGSILYYNQDVLQKAGLDPNAPPKTWDALRQMAKAITDKGRGDVYGIVFGGAETGLSTFVQGFAATVSPQEATGFNFKTGKYAYDSKAILDSFQLLSQLKQDGTILPSSYTLKTVEAGVLFGQGKAGFLVDGRARMWITKRDVPEVKMGLAPVPSPTGSNKPTQYYIPAAASGYVISSKTKHAEEVGKFINEAFASAVFYEKYINSAVAVTPFPAINEKKSLYPYPEYETFVQLHRDLMRVRPDPAVRNPEAAKVIVELGTLEQTNVKPNFSELLQSLLTGAQKDAEGTLKKYNEKMNKGLQDAIGKVQNKGTKINPDDFTFPNWNAEKDYTAEDYGLTKKD
ncbi:ABC transporter substrate-binding protein [Paenibacillus allorhizosphaerae]|uniref:Extracellular solute-binding protein n=1 Tax=Paenibacillus allorhizosphaerae TaxID=2849866 RepID=A0ABM8V9P6_9BACL|nr:extracellular solute-binding protein [Paenibacillus allorhizosphaerae]CAG7613891.1 hypothetical protein PAECIP111802_00023 [Paenibacillus allorhizosphaerae]